jgi:alpha-L-fucosidase 2
MKCGILFFTLFALLLSAYTQGDNMPGLSDEALAYLQKCNVVWDTPSADSSGSMPLGNGDIGVNVWVEPNGDLVFYLSKTDAWSEVNRLLKLGTVRVSLSPSLLNGGRFFRQELRLLQGEVLIQGGNPDKPTSLRVWVDAYRPVVWVDIDSPEPVHVRTQLEIWRNSNRRLEGRELFSAYGLMDAPFPVVEHADTVIEEHRDRVVWFHRNPSSIFEQTLRHQGLQSLIGKIPDPLLYRTFGGMMRGKGLTREDARTLRSASPAKRFSIAIHLLTAQTDTVKQWIERLEAQVARTESVPRNQARAAHQRWWLSFWRRSWIVVSSTPQADVVTQGYALQRFINACAGRGAYPIKFNGSIFTVDSREPDEHFDADYRRWGGEYWFQNTRLPYWSMIPAGDFEMMQPLFKMYANALPLAKERTRLYFGHEGAYFPETITSWGTYASCNYGWNREGKPISHIDNPYIRYYYSCNLELLTLALEYFFHTGDKRFLHDTLLPFADAFIAFYDRHFPRDDGGKWLFKPAQSLETYPDVVNPLPDIAGLRWTLEGLLRLPLGKEHAHRRHLWQRLLGQLPPLPAKTENGQTFLLPAQEILAPPINSENPELYAVFPYRLYGVGKPDIEVARNTLCPKTIQRQRRLAAGPHLGGDAGNGRRSSQYGSAAIRHQTSRQSVSCFLGTKLRLDTRPGPRLRRHDRTAGDAGADGWQQDSAVPGVAEGMGRFLPPARAGQNDGGRRVPRGQAAYAEGNARHQGEGCYCARASVERGNGLCRVRSSQAERDFWGRIW